jgi:hypothetical protein
VSVVDIVSLGWTSAPTRARCLYVGGRPSRGWRAGRKAGRQRRLLGSGVSGGIGARAGGPRGGSRAACRRSRGGLYFVDAPSGIGARRGRGDSTVLVQCQPGANRAHPLPSRPHPPSAQGRRTASTSCWRKKEGRATWRSRWRRAGSRRCCSTGGAPSTLGFRASLSPMPDQPLNVTKQSAFATLIRPATLTVWAEAPLMVPPPRLPSTNERACAQFRLYHTCTRCVVLRWVRPFNETAPADRAATTWRHWTGLCETSQPPTRRSARRWRCAGTFGNACQ